jgi:Rad3-related DNA helicase
MVNSDFLQYARQRIEEDSDHIDEHHKKRLFHELNKAEKSISENSNMTLAELWWMTVFSCTCTFHRKGEGYEKKSCPVCKEAKKMVVENDSDHKNTCPYCHGCFYGSGREKNIVLLVDCKINHDIKDVRALF